MAIFTNNFRKVYLISLAVLTAVIVCWLVFIWLRLDTYEKSMPENAAKQVFNQYFKELAFDKLLSQEVTYISKLETLANYTAYLTERAGGGERNFIQIPDDAEQSDADIKRYVVFSDNTGIAEFELKEQAGFFGRVWKLSGVRTVFENTDELKIIVPSGYEIFVNNKSAGENYKTSAGLFSAMAGTYDIYTISGLIAKPIIEVRFNNRVIDLSFDSEANEYSAIPVLIADIIDSYTLFINDIQIDDSFLVRDNIKTEETNRLRLYRKIYRIPFGLSERPNISIVSAAGKEGVIKEKETLLFVQEFVSDSDLEKQFKERAIAAAKTYTRFMTFDTTIRELQRYFESGTQIYQMIRTSEVYFYTPHKDSWFEKENASEFFPREDETFSCRVTFDNCIRRTASDLFRFPLDVTLFFRKIGGQFMVYNMMINA